MRSIFVGGPPLNCTEDDIKGYFSALYPVSSINMPPKRKSGKCKGFAFVNILVESSQEFSELIKQEHIIRGERVDVHESFKIEEKMEKLKKLQENKIFIGRIPRTEDLTEISKQLSELCEVKNCNFLNLKAKRKALLVMVELSDPKVCLQLSQTGFHYKGKKYAVSLFKPKNESACTSELRDAHSSPLPFPSSSLLTTTPTPILSSQHLNQSTLNYRFNIAVKHRPQWNKLYQLDYFDQFQAKNMENSLMHNEKKNYLVNEKSLLNSLSLAHRSTMPSREQPQEIGDPNNSNNVHLENNRPNRTTPWKSTVTPFLATDDRLDGQIFPNESSLYPAASSQSANKVTSYYMPWR